MKKHKPMIKSPILLKITKLFEDFDQDNKEMHYMELFSILKNIVNFSSASIYFLNQYEKKLELIASFGNEIDMIKEIEFDLGKGLSAWLVKEQRSVLLNNIKGKEDVEKEQTIRSFMSVPLKIESNLYGLINFGHYKANAFKKSSMSFMQVIAPFVAAMLSQNHYIETLRIKNNEIMEINKALNATQNKLLLMQNKEAVSATVGSLNHEINNPLMIISGNLQLLTIMENDEEKLKRLRAAEDQIVRISDILKKLLELESPHFEKYIKDSRRDK
ncbi:MAG TPA: GAF domain-containing protein, partial [Candidatus Cloacimonadota bacterium]|nr:GAF domain-containing protein [Candidatus Cloacimonadota bacterium]